VLQFVSAYALALQLFLFCEAMVFGLSVFALLFNVSSVALPFPLTHKYTPLLA